MISIIRFITDKEVQFVLGILLILLSLGLKYD